MARKYFFFLALFFWAVSGMAATVTPWGNATLKSFDILTANSGGTDLIVEGDRAYLAAEHQGLYILDISNSDNVTVLHQITQADFSVSGFSLYSIEKYGDFVYCGFRNSQSPLQGYLKVVNLTGPTPVVESTDILFDTTLFGGAQVTGLFLDSANQALYAALRLGGVALMDVSDPAVPVLTGIYDPGIVEHQQVIVDRSHNRAYFGGWGRGVGSIDISDPDPANWTEHFIDEKSGNDRYWYLAQRGQYLFAPLADTLTDNSFDEGLAVYDLSDNFADPAKKPLRIGFAPIPAQYQCEVAAGGKDEGLVGGDPGPHQVYLSGDYAIVANGCMGIAIFDISDVTNPFFIRDYEIPGQVDWPWSAALFGDKIITVGRNRNNTVNNDVYVFTVSPVTFSFTPQFGVEPDTMVYSNVATVSGLSASVSIHILNGQYSINNGSFTDAAGEISNNDQLQIRLISSADQATTTESTVTIGGASDTFRVTTRASATEKDEAGQSATGSSAVGLKEIILLLIILLYFRRGTFG